MTITISALHFVPIFLVILGIIGTVYMATNSKNYFFGLEHFLPGIAITVMLAGYYGLFWFFKAIGA